MADGNSSATKYCGSLIDGQAGPMSRDEIAAMTAQLQALQSLLQWPETQAQDSRMEAGLAASNLFEDDGAHGQL